VKFYAGVTDTDWYRFLRTHSVEDVHFWQPGDSRQFGAIAPVFFSDEDWIHAPRDSRAFRLLVWHNEDVCKAG
jgi:hypothetical protein